MAVNIRKAEIKDVPEIFALVQELAKFEKAENEVWTHLDYYQTEFKKGTFDALVAENEDGVVGMCLYYMSFSTWKGRMMFLEDFIVKEAYRKEGIGQLLYDRFLEICKDEECTMAKWQVLDWNEPAIHFYEKNNATIVKDWWDCKVYFTDGSTRI